MIIDGFVFPAAFGADVGVYGERDFRSPALAWPTAAPPGFPAAAKLRDAGGEEAELRRLLATIPGRVKSGAKRREKREIRRRRERHRRCARLRSVLSRKLTAKPRRSRL